MNTRSTDSTIIFRKFCVMYNYLGLNCFLRNGQKNQNVYR
jgi:hypothetical protein